MKIPIMRVSVPSLLRATQIMILIIIASTFIPTQNKEKQRPQAVRILTRIITSGTGPIDYCAT